MTECGDSVCAPPRFRCIEWVLSSDFLDSSKMSWLRDWCKTNICFGCSLSCPSPLFRSFPFLSFYPLQKFQKGKLHHFYNPKNKIQFPNRPRPLKYQSCRYLHRSRHSVIPTCNTTFLAPQCQIDTITSAPSSATKIVSHCLLLRAVNIISWFHYSKTRIYVHRYLQFVSDELGKQI